MTTFGERLRAARKARGLTQVELAARLGSRQSEVSELESGQRRPHLDTAVRVADALGGVSLDWLAGRTASNTYSNKRHQRPRARGSAFPHKMARGGAQ